MKNIIKKLIYPAIYLSIIILIFRNLIFNITTNLIDWGDSAFIAWQIGMLRDKILSLDFSNFYTLNTNYPFPLTVLFTDSFLTQSIESLPFFAIKNPILLYNLLLLLTLLVNYLSAHFLFKRIFKKDLLAFSASFLINNSFFIYDQIIHLQTLSLWPLFLSLFFLLELKENPRIKYGLIIGFLLAIQFGSSVYLAIFQVVMLAVFSLFLFISSKEKLKLIKIGGISTVLFLILTYPTLIKPYLEFEKLYHKIRDINEIIMNSGEPTDLLFPIKGTILSFLTPVKNFIKFNRHTAAEKLYFPGIVLTLGTIFGLFLQKLTLTKGKLLIKNEYSWIDISMIVILLIGLTFSFGPRLKANGQYLEIPLPYLAALKFFPFLHSLRLTHRWIILSLISMVYFSTKFLSLRKNHLPFIIFTLVLFTFESIPINLKTTKKPYITSAYKKIKSLNQNKDLVLLEWPFMNLEKGVPVDYSSRINLSSYYHKAKVVNGYTGIILPEYHEIRLFLENSFPSKEAHSLIQALKVNLIKVNKNYLKKEELKKIKNFYRNEKLYEDKDSLLIRIPKRSNLPNKNEIRINLTDNPVFLGYDNRFFLNFLFKNTSKQWYANTKNDKIKVDLIFLNRNNRIKRKKQYWQRYPIFLKPGEEKKVILDFYTKPDFSRVRVILYKKDKKFLEREFVL